MNVTVMMQAENEAEAAKLARVLSLFAEMLPETKVETTAAAPATSGTTEAPVEDAKARKAAQAKARRAKKKADADAAAKEEADLIGSPDPVVSLDDLKAAVRECVDANGVDAVKAIFESVGAEKLSGIDAGDYADVLAALNERG